MSKKDIEKYVSMATNAGKGGGWYNEAWKTEFSRTGKAVGREILKQLGIAGTVKYNRAGPAVCGDLWVYSEDLFMDLSPSCTGAWWYFRGCDRMGDCGAGVRWGNQIADISALLTLLGSDGSLITWMRTHLESVRARKN